MEPTGSASRQQEQSKLAHHVMQWRERVDVAQRVTSPDFPPCISSKRPIRGGRRLVQQRQMLRNASAAVAAATASCAAGAYSYCASHREAPQKVKPFRVLIVGAGLTGSLTAALIRRRWCSERPLDIHVWERASYPAGRFGAVATHNGAIADLGAQVLSTVDPNDERAREGHGITKNVLQLAWSDVQRMLDDRLLVEAPTNLLCPTEERLNWEGLWRHFWAVQGMSSILRDFLTASQARVVFGLRCDSVQQIQSDDGGTVLVAQGAGASAAGRWACGNSENDATDESGTYEAIVVCVPSRNVLDIAGVADLLDRESLSVLQQVRYDARTAHALFFDSQMASKLRELFRNADNDDGDSVSNMGSAEINFDGDWLGHRSVPGVHYLAWQGVKRGADAGAAVSVVAHCTARPPSKTGEAAPAAVPGGTTGRAASTDSIDKVYEALAMRLDGLEAGDLKSMTVHTKTVDWTIAQLVMPMEAVVADPPSPPWCCMESASAATQSASSGCVGTRQGAKIVIAGDFMTHSSYVGCYASADAAADAVVGGAGLR